MSAPLALDIGQGRLRQVLEAARTATGMTRGDLTVLAAQNDPYRVDTAAGHRDGRWLGEAVIRLVGERRIHLRGLHYVLVSSPLLKKPNGQPYQNTDADWLWVSGVAAKAARWLGYVPFEQIVDHRAGEPIIHRKPKVEPIPHLTVGLDVWIPDASEIHPTVSVTGFEGRQVYALAIFAEKSSVEELLAPIASNYEADLYLGAGEASDSWIYRIARDAVADGRELVVFTITDCDPSGWQMPVSIARKLQALRDLQFPDLEFRLIPVGLTPPQVVQLKLPSTPLKETERRATRWLERHGVEQTEIDALAALQPRLFERIVQDAISPYYDNTLAARVRAAKLDWLDAANLQLEQQVDTDLLENIRAAAEEKLTDLKDQIDGINESLQIATEGRVKVLHHVVPDAAVDEELHGLPLISSAWAWANQTKALIARKAYEDGGAA
jgi:hypothetical protein